SSSTFHIQEQESQDTCANYLIGTKVHPDNFLLNGWALAYHPGVMTNFHHDSDRGVTFVQPVLGKKVWIMAFPKNKKILHTTFLEHSLQLTNLLEKCNKVKANQDMEVVTLLEGDLFTDKKKSYTTSITKPMLTISKLVIKHFWNDMDKASSVYHFGPNKHPGVQSLTHPGELVNREELVKCLQWFTNF
ncbi:uncharacterized protein BJ212DRAFT_1307293, partial [Suillus subaureus]